MTTVDTSIPVGGPPADPEQAAEELAGRIFEAGLAAVELATVHLGDRLGLYRALADNGPLTAADLARVAGIAPRYATEWLEQQACAGILAVDDPANESDRRRYTLPAGCEAVLLDPESPAYVLPLADLSQIIPPVMSSLVGAYRTGAGVPYADYGFHDIQAALNRPVFRTLLADEWIPAIPDVHARLRDGGRAIEFGCGEGWAAIAIAAGYPTATVAGFDLDDASIAAARRHAAEAGAADRVQFEVADVAGLPADDRYDVAFCFEMLHDLARPVEALQVARRLTAGGPVIVMDERVGDRFTAPGDPLERFFYGASVLHCLPVGMAEQPSAATGTVMRPDTLRRYAREAGFTDISELDIEHPMFRFYRLQG
ncbi:class I SAM-dependent methyltransferase [Nakamurella lactea]|uniref:class I SAM-dependent methyltransferase n=1 Tax=Nakamurella lactea TaxID=459515 RepID=UPI000414F44E|nr:methyltransferase domain-containing protein [Nakamurella lactea]